MTFIVLAVIALIAWIVASAAHDHATELRGEA